MRARALVLFALLVAVPALAGCSSKATDPAPAAQPSPAAPTSPLVPSPGIAVPSAAAPALPLGQPAQADADPAHDAQLAVYPLDAQAYENDHYATPDASGHERSALVAAAPWKDGVFGGAYRFRDANDYLSIPDAMTSGLAAGTLAMWVNASSFASENVLLMKRDLQGANELALALDAKGHVVFGTSEALGSKDLVSLTTMPPNQWTSLVVTWGPEGKRIYLNGHLDAKSDDATGVGSTSKYTCLGANPDLSANEGFVGGIDEVRVYGRAVSPAEAAAIMWLR